MVAERKEYLKDNCKTMKSALTYLKIQGFQQAMSKVCLSILWLLWLATTVFCWNTMDILLASLIKRTMCLVFKLKLFRHIPKRHCKICCWWNSSMRLTVHGLQPTLLDLDDCYLQVDNGRNKNRTMSKVCLSILWLIWLAATVFYWNTMGILLASLK